MSIPSTKQNLNQPPMTIAPRMSTGHVEKFEKQVAQVQGQNGNGNAMVNTGTLSKKAIKQQLLSNSHNAKRKYSHSKQSVEHESSEDKDMEEPAMSQQQITFRTRSKTISDTTGNIRIL